jgi:predicted nucleotidyltransferase
MAEIIFTTVHGSRLYGFAHDESDFDTFTVTTSKSQRAEHTVVGEHDRVVVGLERFLELAMSGSHQSVEALFSRVKVWADTEAAAQHRPMLERIRVGGVGEKFDRTIRKFAHGDYKRRRHACRLWVARVSLARSGTMNPTLTPEQVEWCNHHAHKKDAELVKFLLG